MGASNRVGEGILGETDKSKGWYENLIPWKFLKIYTFMKVI